MPTPDQRILDRSQYLGDSIQIAITTTELATPVLIPAGLYQLFSTVACRWKMGGSWCRFAATPSAPSVANVGTAGATTYTYKVVAVMPDKTTVTGRSAASAGGSTTTGNATLDGTNFNRLTITAVTGAESYDVYRTVGGATQGKIGNSTGLTFDDTGLAASGAEPTVSTSVGHALPASVFFGDLFIDGSGAGGITDDAYINAKTDSGTGTFSLMPVTG